MDLKQPRSFNIGLYYYWTNWIYLVVILYIIQTHSLPDGSTTTVEANKISVVQSSDYPVPQALLNFPKSEHIRCEDCRLAENGKICSGSDQGECFCSIGNAMCWCKPGWTGDVCQYQISKISCEKMRNCILCQVHGSGPLAEGKDCDYFCHKYYPTPLIVKTLHFQDDEHLCVFTHYTEQLSECRYFFKFGKINPNGSTSPINFYIIAQKDFDCGKPVKFPIFRQNTNSQRNNETFQMIARSYEEEVKTSDKRDPRETQGRQNGFITIIIFVLIALPFVTCVFSLIYNFSNLPCGLCNIFRQSSSKYLRNVRPFPGLSVEEITSL